jgi:hypothetical protein
MTIKHVYQIAIFICLTALFLGCDAEKISNPTPQTPELAPFEMTLSHIHRQLQGYYAHIIISADSSRRRLGGYDFFLSYPPNALTLHSAEPGNLLKVEGWELFDYQLYSGDQIDSSHLNFIHIYAIKDIPQIDIPPDDFLPSSNELADLEFYVSNNRVLECTFQPVRFYWRNCDDNVLYTLDGDTVAFVDNIYDTARSVEVADSIYIDGWHGPSEDCFTALHHVPVPMVDFINGGITIICGGPLDPSGNGDINVNGLPFEIADAMTFINYFVHGLTAFGGHVESSIFASDVNLDGNPLTVADLVFINRVIVGDVDPHLQVQDSARINIAADHRTNTVTATTRSDNTIGAIYLVIDATASHGQPLLGPSAGEMDMKYAEVNGTLRILIFNIGTEYIASGRQTVLTIPAADAMPLLYAEAATYSGIPMKTTIDGIPQQFELGQNFPNPFSDSTTVPLALPRESDWSVMIFSVEGNIVRQYSGHSHAGVIYITWDGAWQDGAPAENGIYFYRAVVGELSATRRMALIR